MDGSESHRSGKADQREKPASDDRTSGAVLVDSGQQEAGTATDGASCDDTAECRMSAGLETSPYIAEASERGQSPCAWQ